jgi:DNA-binding transcriptional regulator GbsR (MarR family)
VKIHTKKEVLKMKDWYSVDDIVEATGASRPTITRYAHQLSNGKEELKRRHGPNNTVLYEHDSYILLVDKLNATKKQREKRAITRAEKEHHEHYDVDMSGKFDDMMRILKYANDRMHEADKHNEELTQLLNKQSQAFYKSVDYADHIQHVVAGTDADHRQVVRKRRFGSL